MNRATLLLGALLALALGGLLAFGVLGGEAGPEARAAETAARPGAARPSAAADGGAPTPVPAADGRDDQAEPAAAQPAEGGRARTGVARAADAGSRTAPLTPANLLGALRGPEGPVHGAHVRLLAGETSLDDALSDTDGQFELRTDVLDEGLELEVRARGYAPHRGRLRRLIPGESRNLGTVVLLPGRVLDVDVTDAGGRPLEGAAVVVEAAGPGRGNGHLHEGVTGPQGRARFLDAPLGELRVQASAEEHGARVLHVEHDGSGRPVRVALLPENTLTVAVRGPEDAPIPGATVTLTSAETRDELHEGTTDDDGRVRFEGLGAERFDARLIAPGFRTDTRRELVADGREVVHTLLPWPCLTLTVQTPDGGPPPAGTQAWALPNTHRALLLRTPDPAHDPPTTVASDGSARLCNLRPGEYVVRIDAPGFAPTLSRATRVRLDGDVELGLLTVRPGAALVVDVRSRAGEVLAGATVELHAETPAPAALVNELPAFGAAVLTRANTDADGAARFGALTPGEYTVLVRAPGHQARLGGPVHAGDGLVARIGPLELAPGQVVRGVVRSAGGAPISDAVVVLRGDRADAPVQLATDADGRFESPPLAPGTWDVTARALEARAAAQAVETRVRLQQDAPAELELVLGS